MILSINDKPCEVMSSAEEYHKAISVIAHNAQGPIRYINHVTRFNIDNWDKMTPADLLDCAHILNEASKNIDTMLTNLLVWARFKDGSLQVVKSDVLVSDIVASEALLNLPFLKIKNIVLDERLDKNARANTDPNIVRIVFQNILSNALKFSPVGSHIILTTQMADNGTIKISVQDFGKGFPDEEMHQDDTIHNNGMGTLDEIGSGYGLNLSRDLLKLIGGQLKIETGAELPTTVSIIIPAK